MMLNKSRLQNTVPSGPGIYKIVLHNDHGSPDP
jgi:hypothetical protein